MQIFHTVKAADISVVHFRSADEVQDTDPNPRIMMSFDSWVNPSDKINILLEGTDLELENFIKRLRIVSPVIFI